MLLHIISGLSSQTSLALTWLVHILPENAEPSLARNVNSPNPDTPESEVYSTLTVPSASFNLATLLVSHATKSGATVVKAPDADSVALDQLPDVITPSSPRTPE